MPEQYLGLDKPQNLSGTLLGFDYGLRKMGLAVGQTITCTARPLEPLKMRDGIPEWLQLDNIIKQWQPVGLVVGIPVNEDHDDQRLVLAAQKFGRRIRERYRLPVFGIDERLTSFAARQALLDHGGKKALQRNSVDSIAAQFILETWLHSYGTHE